MQLVVIKGNNEGTVYRLHDGINTIGRAVSNRIRLLDPRTSREHCKIRKIGRSLLLLDLGTKNGTLVNGDSAVEQELRIGDHIQVGNTTLKVIDEDYAPEEQMGKGAAPLSFFQRITMSVFGHSDKQKPGGGGADFGIFAPRAREQLWRPHVDTDPPEGRRETISKSDPG